MRLLYLTMAMQHLHIMTQFNCSPSGEYECGTLREVLFLRCVQTLRQLFSQMITFRLSHLGRGAVFSSVTQCHMGRGQTLLSVLFQRTDDHHQQERPSHCEEPLFGLLGWTPQELQWDLPVGRMVQWRSCYISELVPWSSCSK